MLQSTLFNRLIGERKSIAMIDPCDERPYLWDGEINEKKSILLIQEVLNPDPTHIRSQFYTGGSGIAAVRRVCWFDRVSGIATQMSNDRYTTKMLPF